MNLLLVETRGFTEAIPDYFEDDESYRCFQEYLMESPDVGAVMRGCAVSYTHLTLPTSDLV